MSKPYTEQNLSTILDEDLIWRRKELSDMKAAIKTADSAAKPVLLRAIIAMSYALGGIHTNVRQPVFRTSYAAKEAFLGFRTANLRK